MIEFWFCKLRLIQALNTPHQVFCPLLGNPKTNRSWATGVAEEALSFMERQKNETLVMKAQIEGQTFLPHPDAFHDDAEDW